MVKPVDFLVRGKRGLAQPAVKCRGREYLRIIYGPEYTRPEHLERLRQRGLLLRTTQATRGCQQDQSRRGPALLTIVYRLRTQQREHRHTV